jgi:hypothetical protein
MVFHAEGIIGDHGPEVGPAGFVACRQDSGQLHGQVTAVVHQHTPLPAAFPPAVIGGIGPEYQ